jgi:exodeoxyribonuclease VII large subunit
MTNFFDFREKLRGGGERPATPGDGATPLSVSQLTRKIDAALRGAFPSPVLVRGELSNVNHHRPSGHLYFTLKDEHACIDCVVFRNDAAGLRFEPQDGLEVLAWGRVSVYAARGRYQLYVTRLDPVGQGALELAFRQLHARLQAEGLFATERKKPIPKYPLRIALLTSRQTAALQDMRKVLERFPWLRLRLHHVPVQGEGAAGKIAQAIEQINRSAGQSGVEVILLARGGGPLEDLWAFNEEVVARAIAASAIPIVTGIGHEVDTSIADLVADYHAHTPTEAAQVITSHWRTAADTLEASEMRLRRAMRVIVQDGAQRLSAIERHEAFRRPTEGIDRLRQVLDDGEGQLRLALSERLRRLHRQVLEHEHALHLHGPAPRVRQLTSRLAAMDQRLDHAQAVRIGSSRDRLAYLLAGLHERHPRHLVRLFDQRLTTIGERVRSQMLAVLEQRAVGLGMLERHLHAVGPENVLRRGFTITLDKRGQKILRSAKEVATGDTLTTRFADGQVESIAQDPRQPRLFE